MRTIFKTKLDICDSQTVELPQDFRILHLGMQDGVPCIWYECDSGKPLVHLDIYCFGTGHRIPDCSTPGLYTEYIGTVQYAGFVWHYYRSIKWRQ